MTHRIVDVTDAEPAYEAATAAVRAGQLIVLPTDTVYGVGADATSGAAVQRLLDAARGRSVELARAHGCRFAAEPRGLLLGMEAYLADGTAFRSGARVVKSVAGFDVATHAADVRASISLTGQFAAVDEILTGAENLRLIARLRRVPDAERGVADTAAGIALSERVVSTHGALTAGIYSTKQDVIDAMTEATWRSKVALSINLTGGVFVNQSAAYSDYHGTGGNPAANASYSDAAFVANRFCVVQRRYHV